MSNYQVFNSVMLHELIKSASSSSLRRARINFHPNDASLVQEMIICAFPDTKIEIHGHHEKSESFCVLMGDLDIFVFESNRPSLIERIALHAKTESCYYRLDGDNPHLVVPLGEPTVFLEITNGPFIQGANSYAPQWAKDFNVKDFMRRYYNDE